MEFLTIEVTIPDMRGPAANECLERLKSDLLRDPDLNRGLDRKRTGLKRTNDEAMDFGATLLAVLGTPSVIYLARAICHYVERTGTCVSANGIEIRNVRSEDIPRIAKALKTSPPREDVVVTKKQHSP